MCLCQCYTVGISTAESFTTGNLCADDLKSSTLILHSQAEEGKCKLPRQPLRNEPKAHQQAQLHRSSLATKKESAWKFEVYRHAS
jgi:hypothetical protein